MEKAIEIKRRAQRCVQNGDVDGALREYEKLVGTPDADPYNFVLLADLLHKKGDHARAGERYLNAVTAYELAGLFKNGIAVCKKMMRLSLSQGEVLRHLAELHALDGLASEASVYFAQYAEHALRANKSPEAITSLRKAFDSGQENVKLLERLSEVLLLEGETMRAAETMREAAQFWHDRGQPAEAKRCLARAEVILPGSGSPITPRDTEAHGGPPVLPTSPEAVASPAPETPSAPAALPTAAAASAPVQIPPAPAASAPELGVLTGSRIPTTAPTLFPPGAPAPAAASAPVEPPAPPPANEVSPFMPHAGAAQLPRMDSSLFERSPQFMAPSPDGVSEAYDDSADEPAVPAAGVYDIGAEEDNGYEAALRAAAEAEAAGPPPPFDPEPLPADPSPSLIARRPEELLGVVTNVEDLLQRAQDEFRAGHRDRASQALVEAALAYERLDRLDSAATIFRSLGRGAQAPAGVMELWIANCERRHDPVEGAQVACELGDRALNDNREAEARYWFQRALTIHPSNETARRRLHRMSGGAPVQPLPPAAPNPDPATPEMGRVAVAVGRGQAVTFDLGSLLQEFQRGVASQLEGDAQGHYDLGMAYREMGLHDEAVGSFRIAERDLRLAVRSPEMIGRCLADSGRHDEAVREYERALRSPTLDATGESELRYQMALSLGELGELADALAQLEIADMRMPGRSDITQRLEEWRRGFGQAA